MLFVLVGAQFSQAQDRKKDEQIHQWYQVQRKAQFPGGDDAMDKFISKKIKIPNKAYEKAKSGIVVVGFTVEKNGSISNVRILSKKKIGYGVEEAVKDVIRKMPKWEPAMQDGKPVRMAFSKPVRLNFD